MWKPTYVTWAVKSFTPVPSKNLTKDSKMKKLVLILVLEKEMKHERGLTPSEASRPAGKIKSIYCLAQKAYFDFQFGRNNS